MSSSSPPRLRLPRPGLRFARDTVLALTLALAAEACSPAGREELRTVEVLFRDVAVARKHWSGTLIEFGTPAALPFLEEGWSYGETAPDGNTFRWAVGERAAFRLESSRAGERLGWIECEPYRFAGAPLQVVEVQVNGRRLPELRLREGRARYPLEMPLKQGENAVELRFAYARSPEQTARGTDRRPLAAAFYRFDMAGDGEERAEWGPFSLVSPLETRPGIFLPRDGRLDTFVEVPPEAQLSVRVGAERPERLLAPRGSRLVVSVEPEEGDGLTEMLDASAARGEVLAEEISLEAMSGQRVRLSFEARGHPLLVSPYLFGLERAPERRDPGGLAPEDANVLVVVLDGAAASRMSAYGYPLPTTPHIDRLAEQSVVFEKAVSQAVYTIASIGSLLTGQYPERHQSVSFADRLPAQAVTFPGVLTLHGFTTAGFSGNAVVSSTFGLDRGYQSFHPAWELEDYSGHGDSVLRLFFDWLEEHHRDRFLAYVHFREPHFPYNPPAPYDTRFGETAPYAAGIVNWEDIERLNRASARGDEVPRGHVEAIRRLYEGNMAYVDSLVGELLRRLETLDLAKNTIVILTADHGEALFEHGFIGHNTQLYEESVRVPLLVRIPGRTGGSVSQVVQLIDVAPTVLDLVGLSDEAATRRMQGRSLTPFLEGDPLPPRLAYSRTLWDKPRYAVRDARYKLIWDSRTGSVELYDLETDPRETRDRFAQAGVVGGYLRQRLHSWLREQELLRAGLPGPEQAAVPEDLGRYLGGVGYLQYLEKEKSPQ